MGLCERFHSLPEEGGILDQSTDIIRMLKILDLVRPEGGEEYG